MAKKSVAQISREVNGKKVREIEAKSGNITIRFADGSELLLTSTAPVTVEYGDGEEEGPDPTTKPLTGSAQVQPTK